MFICYSQCIHPGSVHLFLGFFTSWPFCGPYYRAVLRVGTCLHQCNHRNLGILLVPRLLLVCWVAVDSSFLLSFVFSSSLPSLKPTLVGLLVVPPGLSLALSGLPFGSQLAVSGTPVRGCVLFSWEVACTWMSPGSLAWWLRSFVLAFGLVILPGLIMVGLVPALCVPGSVLTISRPSVLGSGAIPSPLSKSTFLFVPVPKCWSLLSVLLNTMFGKAGGLRFGKIFRMWQASGLVPPCL